MCNAHSHAQPCVLNSLEVFFVQKKMNSDLSNKRVRSVHNDSRAGSPGPSVDGPSSTRSAAGKKLLAKKVHTVHGFVLPQLEDFDQWPGLIQWCELIDFHNTTGIFRTFLLSGQYLEAWKFALATTNEFLRERLIPYFDGLKDRDDGKFIMVAFVGLHEKLRDISGKISEVFLENASDVFHASESQNLDDFIEDCILEIDIGDYFVSQTRERLDDSRGGLGSPSCNFELSGIHDSFRIQPTSVPGSVPSKRRRTTTPEEEELLDARNLGDLTISGQKKIPGQENYSGSADGAGKFADLEDFLNLSSEKFRDCLRHFSVDNVFAILVKPVQEHSEVFPVVAQPFVHSIVKVYEAYIDLEIKRVDGINASRDQEVRLETKVAVDVFNKTLFDLGLAETVIAPALQILCRRKIKERATIIRKDGNTINFTDFHEMSGWTVWSDFVQSVLFQEDSSSESANQVLALLIDYAKKEYIEGVVDGFFDLLLQWPRSRQSFIALKQLMDETSQDVVHAVIVSLQRQFHSRLLRPGLNTQDILAVYTAAIRALRTIDPSRVIQDLVCEPVRFYLRSRPDTVRCIMSHITHITPTRDMGDNRRNSLPALDAMIEEEEAAIALTMLNPKNSTSDIDMENWRTWQPDPVYVELLPANKRTDRQADTIELLMSIYGGQDVFINEYQLILAEKLLGYYPFDPEEEAKHLKMMTKRFGESLLQKSEVMSRDAADSQKIHEKILTKMDLLAANHKSIPLSTTDKRTLPVKTLVISHHYWPEIRTEKIKVPDSLSLAMADYQTRFEVASETRTIEVRPELGRVEFDLHLDDGRTMHLKCNPVYVAIILQFAQESRWSLDDLSEKIGLSPPVLKKKLVYWQRRNVLEESEADVFAVVADGAFLSEEDLRRMDDEEIESAVRYVAENNQEEQNMQIQLQLFWKYMTTMLSTVQTITIDRLFAMVRMFIIRGQAKKDVTIDHLRQLLDSKVRARELIYVNNRYSLPKKETKEPTKEL